MDYAYPPIPAGEKIITSETSAFNIANALGGVIGAVVVDGSLGPAAIPYAAAVVPVIGVLFILTQEHKPSARLLLKPGNDHHNSRRRSND
ncbi:MAG: hypothetical protein P8O97_01260 [Gammaproteobacteria bacterium]|nr:hypothetical protein [Gammaproteobacteria bacterium]